MERMNIVKPVRAISLFRGVYAILRRINNVTKLFPHTCQWIPPNDDELLHTQLSDR
jgi:hypothetical protein